MCLKTHFQLYIAQLKNPWLLHLTFERVVGELHLWAQLDFLAPFRQNESLLHCKETLTRSPTQLPALLCSSSCTSISEWLPEPFPAQAAPPRERSTGRPFIAKVQTEMMAVAFLLYFQCQGEVSHLLDCHTAPGRTLQSPETSTKTKNSLSLLLPVLDQRWIKCYILVINLVFQLVFTGIWKWNKCNECVAFLCLFPLPEQEKLRWNLSLAHAKISVCSTCLLLETIIQEETNNW